MYVSNESPAKGVESAGWEEGCDINATVLAKFSLSLSFSVCVCVCVCMCVCV